ncbi:MAG: cell division ATPase MinD [Candidatus Nanoarchaeia archaeon]|nr:cell division ATPase MinD [Candidatus Nanoarchaeia archaeon]
MTRIIAVASGKGGVGKTTLTINLASALQQFGKDVIIVDGNTINPNISLHLGLHGIDTNIQDVLSGEKKINESVYIHTSSGLKILPAGISIKEMEKKKHYKLSSVLNQLIGATDIVLVDASAGLGKDTLETIDAGDELIVITNPDIPSVTDALKTVELAKKRGIKTTGAIVNRSTNSKYEMSSSNIEEFLGVPVLGVIPEEAHHIKRSLKLNYPMVLLNPDANASIAIKGVAAKLIGKRYDIIQEERNFFNKLRDFLGF